MKKNSLTGLSVLFLFMFSTEVVFAGGLLGGKGIKETIDQVTKKNPSGDIQSQGKAMQAVPLGKEKGMQEMGETIKGVKEISPSKEVISKPGNEISNSKNLEKSLDDVISLPKK